ncbi:MAG: hypothetical protein RLZZ342_111 [Candidatus Parcubacteria bacterium]|jgi:hypothetical protein
MDKLRQEAPAPVSPETLTGAEDIVLFHLHRCITPDGKIVCDTEALSHIREEFAHCEAFSMYEAYAAGSVPTLPHMRQAVEAFKNSVANDPKSSEEDKKEALQLWKLVGGSLPGAVNRYVQSVIMFAEQAPRFEMMDTHERKEFAVKVDGERRRRHDTLLQVIADIDKSLTFLADELGVPGTEVFRRWQPGMQTVSSDTECLVFNGSAIDSRNSHHRDLIKNWAIAADFDKYFHHTIV